MYFVAHRGYSETLEDNSIQAINAAINYNFDMIEVDVQYTSDDHLVLHHSMYCEKTGKMIYEMDIFESMQNGIVRLEDLFQLMHLRNAYKTKLYLDLKGNVKTAELLVTALRLEGFAENSIYVSSFSYEIAELLKQASLPIYIGLSTSSSIPPKIQELLFETIDFISIDWNVATKSMVQSFKNNGKMVFLFTCHNKREYKHILQTIPMSYVEGIITNIVLRKTNI